MQHRDYIPQQQTGVQKDFKAEAVFNEIEEAEEAFLKAKERLLNINSWHEIAENLTSKFQIKDANGAVLDRHVKKGDLIEINIPGPEHTEGTGGDWVRVEDLAYEDFPDQNREFIVITVRPVSDPLKKEDTTSHFFDPGATSSFVVERINNKLMANYHGRNEKPNKEGDGVIDKVRNALVALGAVAGFSELQWKGLLQGFIK